MLDVLEKLHEERLAHPLDFECKVFEHLEDSVEDRGQIMKHVDLRDSVEYLKIFVKPILVVRLLLCRLTEIQEIRNCRANEFFVSTRSLSNGMNDGKSKICEFSVMMSFSKRSRSSEAFFTETSGSATNRDNAEKISGNAGMIDWREILTML